MRAYVIGSGKTLVFSYMVSEHVKKGGKVLILTHRSELFKQSTKTFLNFGLELENELLSKRLKLRK